METHPGSSGSGLQASAARAFSPLLGVFAARLGTYARAGSQHAAAAADIKRLAGPCTPHPVSSAFSPICASSLSDAPILRGNECERVFVMGVDGTAKLMKVFCTL